MASIQGRLETGQHGAGEIQVGESMRFISGMLEESHQNALTAEIASAERNQRTVNFDAAKSKAYEEAGRRLGQTVTRDGPHGALIQELRKQIKPSHVVKVGTRVVDTNQIGSSRSHRAYANRLTSGLCVNDPLEVDRTPPQTLFPNGKPPRDGRNSRHNRDRPQPEVLELSDSEEVIIVKKQRAVRATGDGGEAGPSTSEMVDDIVARTFDRTKSRVKEGKSPGAKGRFIKMAKNRDVVREAAESYVRDKKKKGEKLLSQECQDEIVMFLPESPTP